MQNHSPGVVSRGVRYDRRCPVGCITKQKQNKRTYYLYSHSYREKIDHGDSGKVRGTGKSRVRTMQVWLGTAEQILAKFQENPQEAVEARSV